jgi:hypothetical protein
MHPQKGGRGLIKFTNLNLQRKIGPGKKPEQLTAVEECPT